jgi:hypothetical protein
MVDTDSSSNDINQCLLKLKRSISWYVRSWKYRIWFDSIILLFSYYSIYSIDARGMIGLANILRTNNKLVNIDLGHNNLGVVGA